MHYLACSSVLLPAYTVNVLKHTKDDLLTGTKQNTAFNNWIDCNTLNTVFLSLQSFWQMAEQLMTLAYENGINLFDTAEVYAAGKWVRQNEHTAHPIKLVFVDCCIAMCWNMFFVFILCSY